MFPKFLSLDLCIRQNMQYTTFISRYCWWIFRFHFQHSKTMFKQAMDTNIMTSDTHARMHTHYTIQLLHQFLELSYNHCNHYHNVLFVWWKQLHHCGDKKTTTTKQAVQLKHKIQPSGTGARPYAQAPVPCDALSPPLKGQTLTEAAKQRRADADLWHSQLKWSSWGHLVAGLSS